MFPLKENVSYILEDSWIKIPRNIICCKEVTIVKRRVETKKRGDIASYFLGTEEENVLSTL